MKKFSVIFNDVEIPEFVKVKAVNTTVLPEISTNYKTIAGGSGVIDTKITKGGKKVSLEVVIVLNKDSNLLQLQRELAFWLRGDNFKLSSLVITDEEELEYKAKINNSVDIKDLLVAGEGTIDFYVPSGVATSRNYSYGTEIATDTVLVDYFGTENAYPIITFTPSQSYKNGTLRIIEELTGNTFLSTPYNFTANVPIVIDCTKRLVKVGEDLHLDLIDLKSKWPTLQARRVNKFRVNLSGKLEIKYKETWL
ncbi:distal tail protein Dit [Clostridium perfringens]|uniref:distal tail protein Dit n=1 Tax=Clostridium perfringens TaxID=1502 RepID=UPI0039E74210